MGAFCGSLEGEDDDSVNARHNSVRLRQMLSALRRSCLSVTLPPTPIVLAPLEIGPGWPGVPIIDDRASASVAADSIASYTSEVTSPLVLDNAEKRIGCASLCDDVVLLASTWAAPAEVRFGEADMVVAFVVAVGGLSSDTLDIAAPEVDGAFPVSSSR